MMREGARQEARTVARTTRTGQASLGPSPNTDAISTLGPVTAWIQILAMMVVAACYTMLPLDRGFPNIGLGANVLNTSIVISAACCLVVTTTSLSSVLELARSAYVRYQVVFTAMLLVGAMRSSFPLVAVRLCMVYFATFVLNYIIFAHLIRNGHWKTVVVTFSVLGVLAAAVEFLEVSGAPLEWYEFWALDDSKKELQWFTQDAVSRGNGTLGNPILFGVLMMLLIPMAQSLTGKYQRALTALVYSIAAVLTISRTILVMALVLGGGYVVSRGRARALALGLAVLLGIGAIGFLDTHALYSSNATAAIWLERLGLESGNNADPAQQGIELRRQNARKTTEFLLEAEPMTLLIGKGALADMEMGQKVDRESSTIDNAFLSILLNNGILGLCAFLWLYGWILLSHLDKARKSLHWYSVLGLLLTGASFDFYGYSTFNIVAVASFASLTSEPTLDHSNRGRVQASTRTNTST